MSDHRFSLHSFMAGHGDCLWIEYGVANEPIHRVLIDAGTQGTFKRLELVLAATADTKPASELLVITHIDADHIAGALPLLGSAHAKRFSDVWFNGRKHLNPGAELEEFGAVQGEKLTLAIRQQQLNWNAAFSRRAIALQEDGEPHAQELAGGAIATVLSPGWDQLRNLLPKWDTEVRAAGLEPGFGEQAPLETPEGFEILGAVNVDALADEEFEEDPAAANGSSIALLLEYAGKRILLGADAHPSVVIGAISKLTNGTPLEVDVFKVPHHGSKYNVSAELIQAVRARYYLFSSNGAYFRHPDKQAVARVVKYAPPGSTLLFNCKTEFNKLWDSAALKTKWGYSAQYGLGEEGISVHLF